MAWYIPVLTPNGLIWVPEADTEPWERSVDASHVNYVTQGLATGDYSRLRDFERIRIAGLRLVTDPATIEELDDRGELHFDQFYLNLK